MLGTRRAPVCVALVGFVEAPIPGCAGVVSTAADSPEPVLCAVESGRIVDGVGEVVGSYVRYPPTTGVGGSAVSSGTEGSGVPVGEGSGVPVGEGSGVPVGEGSGVPVGEGSW